MCMCMCTLYRAGIDVFLIIFLCGLIFRFSISKCGNRTPFRRVKITCFGFVVLLKKGPWPTLSRAFTNGAKHSWLPLKTPKYCRVVIIQIYFENYYDDNQIENINTFIIMISTIQWEYELLMKFGHHILYHIESASRIGMTWHPIASSSSASFYYPSFR